MNVLTGKDAFDFLKAVDDAAEQGEILATDGPVTGYYQTENDHWIAFDYFDGDTLVEQFNAAEGDRARGWAHREC